MTGDSAAAIEEARTAYNALTGPQKAKVTLYETLTAAEAAYSDLLVDLDKNAYAPDSSVVKNPGYWGALTVTDTENGTTVSLTTCAEAGSATSLAPG